MIVIVLTVIIGGLYSRALTDQVESLTVEIMARGAYGVDSTLRQAVALSLVLINDDNLLAYLYRTEIDPLEEYVTTRKLDAHKAVYPFVHGLAVYNARLDLLTGTHIDSELGDNRNAAVLLSFVRRTGDTDLRLFARPAAAPQSHGASQDLLTLVMWQADTAPRNAVVVELYQSLLLPRLSETVGSPIGSFVLAPDGTVLCDSTAPDISISAIPLLSGTGEPSVQRVKLAGRHFLVGTAPLELFGAVFGAIVPVDTVLDVPRRILLHTIVIALIGLAGCVAASRTVTRALYKPVLVALGKVPPDGSETQEDELDYLARRTEALQHENLDQHELLRKEVLYHLLRGELSPVAAFGALERHGLGDAGLYYVVVIENEGLPEQTDPLLQLALRELSGAEGVNALRMNQERVTCLIPRCESVDRVDVIAETVNRIQMTAKEELGVDATAALSDRHVALWNLHEAYNHCVYLLGYRIIHGAGRAFRWSDLAGTIEESPGQPADLEKEIGTSLRLVCRERYERAVCELIDLGRSWPIEHFRYVVVQVLFSCLREINSIYHSEQHDMLTDYGSLVASLQDARGPSDLRSWFYDFFDRHQGFVDDAEHRPSRPAKRHANIAADFIADQFADPGLNIEKVAEEVGLSPSYLSRLFKEETGYTFTDRLARVRVEHAIELLRHTTLNVEQVALHCGFANSTYFFAFFKKHVGLTPSRYRSVAC